MTDQENAPQEKKKKPKGPFRFEAAVPVIIVFILAIAYGKLFFDSNLRTGMQWTLSYLHGAEVNIASVNTSFLKASFSLSGLEITDKKQPERNLVKIGEIRLGLLWDALLRAKFVINEAAIEHIEAYSPRKSPGYITPPSTVENTAIGKVEKQVKEQAKEQYSENILGDVASVMGGTAAGEQVKDIGGELKADKKISEVSDLVKEKEKAWQKRLDELPKSKELDALVARAKKIKLDTKNPAQFAKDLKELQAVVKEGDAKVKAYSSANKEFQSDLKAVDQAYKDIDKMIQQDLNDLQKRLKIPNLDVGSFSKDIFGQWVEGIMANYGKYIEIARQYMPPKKTAEEKQPELTPRKRGAGRDVRFRITTGYPLFWLKKGLISSKSTASEYSGDVSGEIIDLTSNPVALGRPAFIKVKGDFPKQKIMGFDATLEIDHTTDDPVEKLVASISSFPTGAQKLLDSGDTRLNIKNSRGSSQMQGLMRGQEIKVLIENKFNDVEYDVAAADKTLNEILIATTKSLPAVSLDAKIKGKLSALRFSIDSNLGRELGKGIQAQIAAKLKEKQEELKRMVMDRVAGEKEKLQAQINKVKGQVDSQLKKTKGEIDKAQKVAKNELKTKQKNAKKSQGKKLEKDAKKLLKGLGL